MRRVRFSVHRRVGEARLLEGLLSGAGFSVEVRREALAPLGGEIPDTETWVELWLPEEEVARARELEAEVKADSQKAELTVDCPRCGEGNPGNFELCWSCGSEIPATPHLMLAR